LESDVNWPRNLLRWILGAFLLFAGVGHMSFSRAEFQAQVPVWLPLDPDFVVLASGVVEIALGLLLIFSKGRIVGWVGIVAATFFIAIFPGNINQYVEGIDAFGLDSDQSRLARLFFQPVLVIWAIWSTGAVQILRSLTARGESRRSP
jgi:uncharacterized membrane protein